MDNIIINFTSNTEGLDQAAAGLENVEVADKAVSDQAKVTMDAYAKRDKVIKESATGTKKTFDALADSASKLTKNIIGGSFDDTFKKIRNEVNLTDKQFKIFLQNIQKQAKVDLFSAKNQAEVKQYKDLIAQAGQALTKLSIEQNDVAATSVSMKTRLRELKVELQQLEDQGKENTAEFERLQIEAGKVEDQISDTNQRIKALGSDTFAFDAIISGVTGIAGAFSIAQGAAALLGSEDEDLQKALLKVNGAMAILQGLTQVQNVLQKQSTISIAISSLLRKKDAAATLEQAAAQSAETVTAGAATVATEELNVAMAANPAGIILVAIVAITSALLLFGNESEDAAEKASKLNEELQKQFDLAQKLDDPGVLNQQKIIDNLNQQIALRKSAGASDAELSNLSLKLRDAEIKKGDLVIKSIDKNAADLGITVERAKEELASLEKSQLQSIKTNKDVQAEILKLRRLYDENQISASEEITQVGLQKQKIISANELKAVETRIALLRSIVEPVKETEGQIVDAVDQRTQQVAEIEQKGYTDSLKSARAYAEARLIIARSGTEEALKAEVAAIRARQREESADPNLTPGERLKITVQANKDIEKANEDFERNAIQQAKSAVDIKLSFAKEGTAAELDLKLKSLELQYLTDITDKTKTVQQLLAIDDKYTSDKEKMYAASNRRIAEDVINQHIAEAKASITNLQAAGVDSTNADLLQAKKDLIDQQAALEILSIQNSQENEKVRAAKIKLIYAQELADKRELERAKTQAEGENDLANRNAVSDAKISRAQAELNNTKLTNKQRIALEDEVFNAQKQKLADLQDLNVEFYANGIKDVDAFNREKLDIQTQSDILDIQREQTKEERKLAIRKQYEDLALKAISTSFSFVLDGYDQEEARLRQLYQNKQISEKDFQTKSKKIQQERAEIEKELAIFQVLVSEGPAVIKGFQQGGFAGAAAALSLVLSLLAATRSTNVPGFKKGKVGINGPGTDTSDSIVARISRNESVINADQTRKHRDALEAINNDTFGEWLKNNITMPDLYQNLTEPNYSQEVREVISNYHSSQHVNFDKEGLAELIAQKIGNMGSIARAIADIPGSSISIDEEGFTVALRKQNDIIEFKNKKLNL